jgi:predicted phosphodiesterase
LEQFRQRLGPADLVVVSGDVAFAGHPEEYEFATNWLKLACNACGASIENVFVVPGNHDVDRSVANQILVQLLHQNIKATPQGALSNTLLEYLTESESSTILYRSITSYNLFASQFFCAMIAPNQTRATRELKLNDGSALRLWGINSAFVSSSSDRPGDLFVDPATFQITRHPGVVNMVVTHHHPSWLRQRQEVEDHYADVAQLQIFGHIHTNRIDRDPHFVRLTASAMHPEHNEPGWEPGYNVLELNVDQNGDQRRLHVLAHVRVWQTAPGQFRAKMDRQKEVFEHWIDLEPWKPNDVAVKSPTAVLEGGISPSTEPLEGGTMSLLRELGIRFYGLSFSQKSEIAGRLGLLEEEDMTQPDFERFRRVFVRASQRDKLKDLKQAIEEAEGHSKR